jgi:hypothetical protein
VKIHVAIPKAGTGTFSPWNARLRYPRMTWLADGVADDGTRLMGTMATEVDLVAVRALLAQGAGTIGAAVATAFADFPRRPRRRGSTTSGATRSQGARASMRGPAGVPARGPFLKGPSR